MTVEPSAMFELPEFVRDSHTKVETKLSVEVLCLLFCLIWARGRKHFAKHQIVSKVTKSLWVRQRKN